MNLALSFLTAWIKPGIPTHGSPQAKLFLADATAQRALLAVAAPFIDAPLCNGNPMGGWSGILRSSPEAQSKMADAVREELQKLDVTGAEKE